MCNRRRKGKEEMWTCLQSFLRVLFFPLLQSLQASKDLFLRGVTCCSSAASHTLRDMNVSSGSNLTQPLRRASWPGPPPITWEATVSRWALPWKYSMCHKRIRAHGNAACMAQKANWEQWSMGCRSQVLLPMDP